MADPKPVYFWVPPKDRKDLKKKAGGDKSALEGDLKTNGGKIYGPYYRKKKAPKA